VAMPVKTVAANVEKSVPKETVQLWLRPRESFVNIRSKSTVGGKIKKSFVRISVRKFWHVGMFVQVIF
jgi:hypothetical protein